MKRLQSKASNAGKQVSKSDDGDCLYIDSVVVFSLKDGFIRNVGACNLNDDTNG